MTQPEFYSLIGLALFVIGVYGVLARRHLIRRILGINIMGGGIFMTLCAFAAMGDGPPDPVPHAMVITGIVVAVSATALALSLAVRLKETTGRDSIDDPPAAERS